MQNKAYHHTFLVRKSYPSDDLLALKSSSVNNMNMACTQQAIFNTFHSVSRTYKLL